MLVYVRMCVCVYFHTYKGVDLTREGNLRFEDILQLPTFYGPIFGSDSSFTGEIRIMINWPEVSIGCEYIRKRRLLQI